MRGFGKVLGSDRRIFAGKQRLREEPFCPFMTNETGYQELFRSRSSQHNPSALGNTGSFGPIRDHKQKHAARRQRWW